MQYGMKRLVWISCSVSLWWYGGAQVTAGYGLIMVAAYQFSWLRGPMVLFMVDQLSWL